MTILQKYGCNDWDKFLAPKYIVKTITFEETRPIPPLKMKRETCQGTNGHDDQKDLIH
jgi:hypothetical protein